MRITFYQTLFSKTNLCEELGLVYNETHMLGTQAYYST